MAVLGSSILELLRFSTMLVEAEPLNENFSNGSEERGVLENIIEGLDIADDARMMSGYHVHHRGSKGKSHARPYLCESLDQAERAIPAHKTFAHFCIFLCHYIMHREIKLDTIHWGFFGRKNTSNGRRTTLSEPLLGWGEKEK